MDLPEQGAAVDRRTRLLRARLRLIRVLDDLEGVAAELYAIGFAGSGRDFYTVEARIVQAMWSGLDIALLCVRAVVTGFTIRIDGSGGGD